MKSFALLFATIFATCSTLQSAVPWTHAAEVGEDASSSHYYLYHSNGSSVERVRWVWNGGAQNAPKVTEYSFDFGNIKVRHLIGKREFIPALIKGEDAELVLKEEYIILTSSTRDLLVSSKQSEPLSIQQRVDLGNLISLLALEREPLPK